MVVVVVVVVVVVIQQENDTRCDICTSTNMYVYMSEVLVLGISALYMSLGVDPQFVV